MNKKSSEGKKEDKDKDKDKKDESEDKNGDKKTKSPTAQSKDMGISVLFGPEAVIMLGIAGIVDLVDFLIGSIPIIDVFVILFFGLWTFVRSGKVKVTKKAGAQIAKVTKWAKTIKWLKPVCIILEFIPVIGMLPLWVLVVYAELRSSP